MRSGWFSGPVRVVDGVRGRMVVVVVVVALVGGGRDGALWKRPPYSGGPHTCSVDLPRHLAPGLRTDATKGGPQ